jgi:hypothetical protein
MDNMMERKMRVFQNHEELAKHDHAYFMSLTPEERLDLVEILRLEAGKFLYDYPSRLRRTVTVTRRT